MEYNRWKVTLQGHDALLIKMKTYSKKSEQTINDTLKKVGGDIAVNKITNLIPVSDEELRNGRRHAKTSKPLKVEFFNLGFKVKPKSIGDKKKQMFTYLKYPDLGIGRSINNQPQDFMQRGLVMAVDPITDELMLAFDALNK